MKLDMVEIVDGSRHRLLAPRVAFVIGTVGPEGPNASPISNVMQLSWSPAYVAIAVWHEWTTNQNLKRTNGFTISVPTVDQSEIVWRLGHKYSGYSIPDGQTKIESAGGNWDFNFSKYGPVLQGAVGWIECEMVENQTIKMSDHTLFVGKIIRALGDADIVDEDGMYKKNPQVISQVTGNLFSSAGEFFSLPWFDKT